MFCSPPLHKHSMLDGCGVPLTHRYLITYLLLPIYLVHELYKNGSIRKIPLEFRHGLCYFQGILTGDNQINKFGAWLL